MNRSPADPKLLDLAQIEELRQIDSGRGRALARIIGVFLSHAPERIASLRAQAAARDFPQIASIAHALKGSSGNVGASRVADVCRRIELAGKNLEAAPLAGLIQELEAEFAAARLALLSQSGSAGLAP